MNALSKLENTNKYLFHGSSIGNIEWFEPKQAYTHGIKDGLPCIAASEYYEPAVFMAVLGSKKLGGWSTNDKGEILYFLLCSEYNKAIQEAWSGYVYVLARDSTIFKPYNGWEWRAYTQIKPVDKVYVSMSDLPKNIKLLDDYVQ